MGCGASSKPSGRGGSHGHKYTTTEASKVPPEEMSRMPSNDSKDKLSRATSNASDTTRASSRSSISSNGSQSASQSWHCAHCTDVDLSLVKTIDEAYPFDDDKKKSISISNRKNHGGSYADISVAKMGPKQIHCSVCGVFVLTRYEEAPFYYCKRCRVNDHRLDLCVSCYDHGELATGPRQRTSAGACKAQPYSYKLRPSVVEGSPLRRCLLDDEETATPSPRPSPRASLILDALDPSPRSGSRSPRPSSDDTSEPPAICKSLSAPVKRVSSKSPRPPSESDNTLPVSSDTRSKSPRPSPRREDLPVFTNPKEHLKKPKQPNAFSPRPDSPDHVKSPRPSPRTKTMPDLSKSPRPSPRGNTVPASPNSLALPLDRRQTAPKLLTPSSAGDTMRRSSSKGSTRSNQ